MSGTHGTDAAPSGEEDRRGDQPPADPAPLRLAFARGVAPSKWAKRWARAVPDVPLELVPLDVRGRVPRREHPVDVMLERAAPGERPESARDGRRHAIRLYTEALALVVAGDHELAEQASVVPAELALVPLLDHPGHAPGWPAAEPWDDPSFMPADAAAALELVATGIGAILLPLPLARHLSDKRAHAVVPVVPENDSGSSGDVDTRDAGRAAPAGVPPHGPLLEGGAIWATWEADRDAPDVQQLVGILRGRSARSSRAGSEVGGAARAQRDAADRDARERAKAPRAGQAAKAAKAKLAPNSRGAQLAAAKAKAERKKAEKQAERKQQASKSRRRGR